MFISLTRSRLFALSDPLPGHRSFGVRIWDWTHVYAVVIAQLSLPIGVPVALFLVLNLDDVWRLDDTRGAVDVAQLITASVVGAIAINIFLSSQLPRLAQPRIACSFLMSSSETGYFERYLATDLFAPKEARWIHLRLTNIGTIYYSAFVEAWFVTPAKAHHRLCT